MTNKIQSMTIILMTTIMLTGGVVPYSFANDDDFYDDEDVCEVPWEFAVMYDGPPNAEIEIYKKSKQAKNGERMLKDFPGQTFSSGDYIILNAENDLEQGKINPRTVYKIMHGSDWEIITFNTSCEKPIAKYDSKSKGGKTLTIDYGKDKHGDDVIYEKYRHEKPNTIQQCVGTNEVLLDFESDELVHGSQQTAIQTYLSGIGPVNFEIMYDADSNGPVNDPGAIYDSRNNGGADPDLEDPEPNPPIVGNMLIIQENNQQSGGIWTNPDDEASGGKHFLTFEDGQGNPVGVDVLSWRNIDLEGYDEQNQVTVKFLDGSPDLTKNLKKTGNDAHEIQEEGEFTDVKKITYDLDSSGGITDICIRLPDAPVKGSITVTKVIEEQIPSGEMFDFSLDGGTVIPLGNGDSHIFMDLDPNTYVLAETLESGYSLTIDCDSDGAIIDKDEDAGTVTITLNSNETPACTFTNTEIIPTTLTIKKALTNDNSDSIGNALPADFAVKLTHIGDDEILNSNDDVSLPIKNFVDLSPSMGALSFEMLTPGMYVLNETITNQDVQSSYTTVLVSGDTACPSMENEVFTIDEGGDIICSIYNDDNFVAGAAGPAPTVSLNSTVVDPSLNLADDFTYVIGGAPAVNGSQMIPITANTPAFFNQTNNMSILPTKIIGDGNCPEALAGEITLSPGQNISCTLVYGTDIQPGVSFGHSGFSFKTVVSLNMPNPDLGPRECTDGSIEDACVENLDVGGGNRVYLIVDSALTNAKNTLVLWDLKPSTPQFISGSCIFVGIFDSVTLAADERVGFGLTCGDAPQLSWDINYAFINTDFVEPP